MSTKKVSKAQSVFNTFLVVIFQITGGAWVVVDCIGKFSRGRVIFNEGRQIIDQFFGNRGVGCRADELVGLAVKNRGHDGVWFLDAIEGVPISGCLLVKSILVGFFLRRLNRDTDL